MADLTEKNQRALRVHRWHENLTKLREAAEWLDAIIGTPAFCRNVARQTLGVPRSTFFRWFSERLRLSEPLVPYEREQAINALLAAQRRHYP
jgi:hypothetical protein